MMSSPVGLGIEVSFVECNVHKWPGRRTTKTTTTTVPLTMPHEFVQVDNLIYFFSCCCPGSVGAKQPPMMVHIVAGHLKCSDLERRSGYAMLAGCSYDDASEGGERETREILLDLMLIRPRNSLSISPRTTSKIVSTLHRVRSRTRIVAQTRRRRLMTTIQKTEYFTLRSL